MWTKEQHREYAREWIRKNKERYYKRTHDLCPKCNVNFKLKKKNTCYPCHIKYREELREIQRKKKNCIFCGKEFKVFNKVKKYCSYECAYKSPLRCASWKGKHKYIRKCTNCGKDAILQNQRMNWKTVFCNSRCAYEYKNSHIDKICPNCKKTFGGPSYRYKKQTYCSNECAVIAQNIKGRKVSMATRFKMSHTKLLLGQRSAQNNYSRTHKGKRADLGMYFRSSMEANYARYLNFLMKCKNIAKWEYEPETFWFNKIRRGCLSYMPDFRITNNDGSIEYHETKGWMDKKSKTKLKRMAKYYPAIKLILIDWKQYKAIEKSIKPLIPEWEKS